MDNVIALSFGQVPSKDESGFVQRITTALSGLPAKEQERIVRLFELMALSMEIEMMERNDEPKGRR